METNVFTFPAGEVHYIENQSQGDSSLTINEYLICCLLMIDSERERCGAKHDLILPYLPYSRQDRPMEGQPFSLKTIGKIINAIGPKRVITLDVHSNVAYGCINNLVSIPPDYLIEAIEDKDSTYLIVPDIGAYKRLEKYFPLFPSVSVMIKNRDAQGQIIISGYIDIKLDNWARINKFCIVDDICDGGATFLKIVDYLRERNSKIRRGETPLELAVSHTIQTKRAEYLLENGIDKLITTDSFPNNNNIQGNVKILNSEKIIEDFLNEK